MFSKELENLIQATLVDGKIDDVEKKALLSRAKKEGVDPDELEVYINSLLQKRILSKTAEEDALEAERMKRKSQAIGRICPHCGTPLPPLAENCPSCGALLLTASIDEKIEAKFETIKTLFAKAEKKDINDSSDKQSVYSLLSEVDSILLEMRMYYGTVTKVQVFCDEMEKRSKRLRRDTKKKISFMAKYWIVLLLLIAVLFVFLSGK